MSVAVVDVREEVVRTGVLLDVVHDPNVAMEWGRRDHMVDSVRNAVMMEMESVAGHSQATSVSPLPMNRHPCAVAAGEDNPAQDNPAVREAHHHEVVVVVSPQVVDSERHPRGAKIRMPAGQRPMCRMPISTVRTLMRTSRKNERCAVGETNRLQGMSKASRIGSSLRGTHRGASYVERC